MLVLLLLSVSSELFSQVQFPDKDGERAKYDVKIDIRKAYISGVCMMMKDEGIVKASIVNEFGLSAVDFTYNPSKDKVKILNVMSKMNKWYIRRVLRKDLRNIMHQLPQGIYTYENKKQHIIYTFNPLKDDTKE
ncbi:MAG: hypothetical protein J5663_06095 [Bacteroidaceae bacterium]|nr:hypothetical protein [Bacteroidaceae bacterium]